MPPQAEGRPRLAELEQAIRNRIAERTRVRIQALVIEVNDNRVVVRGCVPCYYLKQLVLQGVLDVVGSADAIRIELDVDVVCVLPEV